jgi:hypothetical protein
MDEDEVIDISPIVFHFQSFLHKSIKLMHIDIRKYLTREIPDRESASGFHEEKTLITRESDPIISLPEYLHALFHIGEDDCFYQVQEDILFV